MPRQNSFFRISSLLAPLIVFFVVGCGGGGGSTPSSTPVSINSLDGVTNIDTTSSFAYSFSQIVNSSTVTNQSFFLVPTPAANAQATKAAFDSTICNATNALTAIVSCTSTMQCLLDPTSDLQGNTSYTVCLSTAILYSSGLAFEGFMATFTTGTSQSSVSGQVVRLDGTVLEFSDKPIPRTAKIKLIPSTAITTSSAQQAFEAATSMNNEAGTSVTGTYVWAADGTSVLFTPSNKLSYNTIYTISVGANAIAEGSTATTLSFTTATKNDINGDGFADLISGAFTSPYNSAPGKFYIFYGTATGIAACDISSGCTPGATLAGSGETQLGFSSTFAGDVNGDGYEDFLLGAPNVEAATPAGAAYLFLGGTTLTGTLTTSQATATITHTTVTADTLGYSVAGVGDMNNDGYDDVIIGAPEFETSGNSQGQAYLFLGGSTLTGNLDVASANQTLTGQNNDHLGGQVAGAGDVNGDGFADVIVSSLSDRAYVFYGAASLTSSRDASAADAIITGAGSGAFGTSVSGAGDVNGDGRADVVVGDAKTNAGKAYVFLGATLTGNVNAATQASTIISTSNGDDGFGFNVASGGDIDHDGKSDLMISGFTACPDIDPGRAYIFLGKNLIATMNNANADAIIAGAAGGEVLSFGLGKPNDLNNDGYDDLVIGAPHFWTPAGPGHIYIFNGSVTGVASCDLATTPTCPSAILTGATSDALGLLTGQPYNP